MSKEQFVQKQNVPPEDAKKAWDVAEGDEDEAVELLQEQSVWVKGQFTSSNNPATGYFLLNYDFTEDTSPVAQGVVLSSDEDVELLLSSSHRRFRKDLESVATHDKKMNANTQQLNSAISSAVDGSELTKHLTSKNSDGVGSTLETRFGKEFDFKIQSVRVQLEVERPVHSARVPTSDSTDEQQQADQVVEMPCDVEITPLGVPVGKLEPGDEILVSIGSVERSHKNKKRELEATADPETGMVRATLESKRTSDVGTLRLQVKLSDDVIGHISCGQDVSIRVPDSTQEKNKVNAGENELQEFFQENWIAVATAVIVVILLISLVTILTM